MVNGSSNAGAAGAGTGSSGGSKLTVKLGGKALAGAGADAAKKGEAGGSEVKGEPGRNKGKAKARVDWTPAQVEQLDAHELGRHWGPQLFSLQEVIQRAVAQVFGELQLVAET